MYSIRVLLAMSSEYTIGQDFAEKKLFVSGTLGTAYQEQERRGTGRGVPSPPSPPRLANGQPGLHVSPA